ncbi:MAG: hypothetical protein MHM6MM_000935 [Cercozoa sp. M6MM]
MKELQASEAFAFGGTVASSLENEGDGLEPEALLPLRRQPGFIVRRLSRSQPLKPKSKQLLVNAPLLDTDADDSDSDFS